MQVKKPGGPSLMELLDEDNDGVVTQAEFDAAHAAREKAIAAGEIVEEPAKTLGEMLAPALGVLEVRCFIHHSTSKQADKQADKQTNRTEMNRIRIELNSCGESKQLVCLAVCHFHGWPFRPCSDCGAFFSDYAID